MEPKKLNFEVVAAETLEILDSLPEKEKINFLAEVLSDTFNAGSDDDWAFYSGG